MENKNQVKLNIDKKVGKGFSMNFDNGEITGELNLNISGEFNKDELNKRLKVLWEHLPESLMDLMRNK